MNKVCKNCNCEFEIIDEDLAFYEKVSPIFNGVKYNIPAPDICYPCRQQKRLSFRNERCLYNGTCDCCGKNIISIFSPEFSSVVYCADCWWSDKWNALDYRKDFDFNRPFFGQFKEFKEKIPQMATRVASLDNSPYVNQCWHCKNTYLCFNVGFAEDSLYSEASYHSKNIVDCSFTRKSEFSYFLLDSSSCNNSQFLQDCRNCYDAFFSYDCSGCNNVAFCYNLRNQKNCIFNKQVTEKEFKEFKKQHFSGSYKQMSENKNIFIEKLLNKAIRKNNHNINVENCCGDYLLNSKNCSQCYDCDESEDLKYCTYVDEKLKDSMDIDNASFGELSYNGSMIAGTRSLFNIMDLHSSDCLYSELPMSSMHLFGCMALKNKQYCILNKQYTKEEYEELVPKIIDHMKKTGEWGEFFPISLSPFSYNESVVNEYYPLSKEEVLNKGYRWKEKDVKEYAAQNYIIQDNIKDVLEDICNEVLSCEVTGKNYKIIKQELEFYRKMNLPIPRRCSDQRHIDRMALRNPRKLWDRNCMNCNVDIKTTYSPERKEIVYCENCYNDYVYK